MTLSFPRKHKTVVFYLSVFFLVFGIGAKAQVQVSATAGTTGPTAYTTVKSAFDAINAGTHQGTINIVINANTTEIAMASLNASGSGSASYTSVNIKPQAGTNPVISGVINNGPIIKLNGSNNVTIDGSNNGSTSRNLTITNTNATSPNVLQIGSVGTIPISNVTVKNSTLINGSNTSTAVFLGDANLVGNPGYFNNIRIQNNSVQKAYIGVYCYAVLAASNGNNTLVTENNIDATGVNAIRLVGIYAQGLDGITISNNHIGNFETASQEFDRAIWLATATKNAVVTGNTIYNLNYNGTSSYAPIGINISPGITNANIGVTNNIIKNLGSTGTGNTMGIFSYSAASEITYSGNEISNIKNTNTGGSGAAGILLAHTINNANTKIYNNFIWDIAAYGFNGYSSNDNGNGIVADGGGGYDISFNTVILNTNPMLTGGHRAACVLITANTNANGAVALRNNILANLQTVGNADSRLAIANLATSGSAVFSNINYNSYYSTSTNLSSTGTNASITNTIAQLQTSLGGNANSVNINPILSGANDLHLVSPQPQLIGTPIAGISTDIDGETRHATSPYMGADEYSKRVTPDANGIVYVKKGSTGNGPSWNYAISELADALKAAKTNTDIKEIWVAGGTYQPMYSPADNNFGNADGRNNAFLLVKDVKVYGGFAGTETALAQRDLSIVANKTTLSGDYNDNDVLTGYGNTLNISNNSENARQVLISVGDIGTAVLDGFTIKGGNADGSNLPAINAQTILVSSWGGGLYVYNSPTLALNYIQFVGNKAFTGGAMAVAGSNAAPKIENVAFTQNYATQAGGALYSAQSLSLVSTLFLGNKSESIAGALLKAGGGMFLVDRCFFAGNSSAGDGGAIYDQTGVGNTYINTVFSANQSGNKGGALFIGNIFNTRTNSFINCTFSGNTATQGSATVEWTSATTSYTHQMEIINSIVNDGENAIGAGGQVKAYLKNTLLKQSSAPLANIIMQGNSTSLLNLNPSFTDTNGADNVLGTADDDLTLTNSPAIGAGDNSLYTGNINTDKDLAGNPRLVGNNIDLGAYESAIQPQTITAANLSRTYGDADFEPGATASSGLAVSYASADNSIAEAYQDVNDGNKWKLKIKKVGTINVTASQAGGNGYAAAPDKVFVLTIQPKALTVTATGNDKIYDATTNAVVNLNSNALAGDVVTLAYTSAAFGDDNVGNNKTITVNGISLSGTSAANYTFNTTASTTANITPFALTVSATANNRVYDATNNATVDLSSNAFAGDNLTLSYVSATFNDKTVANGKAVSVSGISLSGTDAGNYTFNTTASTTANITPFVLTVSATGNNRVYDATNNATVNLSSNAFAGDNLTLAYSSATFSDKAVANGKAVSVSGISLSGTDAGNYTFNTTASATANITPFALTVSATANNRVYNATNNATVDLSSNAFAGDMVTLAYTSAAFNDKSVANGKTVSVSGISLSGTDAGNYTFNTTASATANITPFALTISASASNKVYNGNTDATVTLSHNGFAGDVVTLAYASATFNSRDVANNKAINITGISLSGTDAGNYTFNATTTATATITPATLNIVAQARAKTYGDADPALTYTPTGLIGGDAIGGSLARTSGENVGTYAITQGTLTAGPNYVVSFTGASLAINRATLTVTAANAARCYGQANPSFSLNYNGFRFSDNENSLATRPQATTTANASSAAGNYAITVSGGSSANYTLVYANGSLRVDALPNVSIVPSRQGAIGRGLTLQLMASGGNSYSWASAGGIISGQNGATLTIRPTANTTYTVTVANNNGCSSTASYAVAVEDDLSILKATNLLSPNGDGVNDVWKVDNMDMYPRAVVRIFDKAGRVVYTKRGYDNTWDGTYNGQPLAENTYYYTIDLEAGKVLRGYITLVRDR